MTYQLVLGANPVDLFGWDDGKEDLFFARDRSPSEHFLQQWKLRMMAQEAASKEVDNGKLRRLSAPKRYFNCVDVKIGNMGHFQ